MSNEIDGFLFLFWGEKAQKRRVGRQFPSLSDPNISELWSMSLPASLKCLLSLETSLALKQHYTAEDSAPAGTDHEKISRRHPDRFLVSSENSLLIPFLHTTLVLVLQSFLLTYTHSIYSWQPPPILSHITWQNGHFYFVLFKIGRKEKHAHKADASLSL